MSGSRLSTALAEGLVAFPDGVAVSVWGARADMDLTGVPPDACHVAAFRPDHDALAAAGRTVVTAPPAQAAVSIVFLPRDKALARATVAEAARVSSGPVVVDGQKTDGIESVLKELRALADLSPALSKAHGKLAVLAPGADLSPWADRGPQEVAGGFVTRAGMFSSDGPDPGSEALAGALPARLGPRVADLGAGWGFLSRAILARDGVEEVHLVEADLRALGCARANVTDPRAVFHWADALRFEDPARFDAVVTNPPFHKGPDADPEIGRAFIRAAARLLSPQGTLWLVANRHLPYEKALGEAFGSLAEIGGNRSYKLIRATRPQKQGAIA